MKQNASILNNSYNNVSYGEERTQQNANIAVDPRIDIYEESTTEDISNLYSITKLYEVLYNSFKESKFYEKYGKPILKKKYQEEKVKITNDFVIGDEDEDDVEFEEPYIEQEEVENDESELDEEQLESGDAYGLDDDYINDPSIMEKYDFKKVEKSDISEIYYYFKDILVNKSGFNELETFCAIAEFFKFNYATLYHDVISIESKAKILNILKENHKLGREFKQINKLY